MRRQGTPILDLTGSNPTSAANYPHALIRQAFTELNNFTYNPEPGGLLDAREAVSGFHQAEGFNAHPSRILFTASTSEAYSLLFKLLCDAGDEVLVPSPSYPLFEYLGNAELVRIVPYRLHYDGSWSIDFDHFRRQLSVRSRAVIIVNPNNPTGSFLKKQEVEQLVQLSRAYQLPIISDEVFMSYPFGNDTRGVRSLVGEDRVLSFSLNGMSKAAGMPQMKLAWIVVNGPAEDCAAAQERLELLFDTYLSVSTPVQLAAPSLLSIGGAVRKQLQEKTMQNVQHAQEAFRDSPVSVLHTEGGWSVILRLPATQTEERWIEELLTDQNLLLHPGFFFDMPGGGAYAIASLIAEPDEFAEGIARLNDYVVRHC